MTLFSTLLNMLGIGRVDRHYDEAPMTRLAEREFLVPNMVCEGCAEKMTGALTSMAGVRDVRSNVREKRIRVRFEPESMDGQRIKDALSTIGFTALDA